MNRTRGYWIATGLFCVALSLSGLGHLLRIETIAESMRAMGYPLFVSTILGTAKLFGVGALLMPGKPLLKEWAYAGFTFNLLGAFASHLAVGDSIVHALPPALLLGIGGASYLLRPASRRL